MQIAPIQTAAPKPGVTSGMDFNPHTSNCINIANQINKLIGREKEISDELRWHSNLDIRTLTEEQNQCEANAAKLQTEIAGIERDIAVNRQQLAKTKSETRTLFNPANWFDKGQVALRSGHRELSAIGEQFVNGKKLKEKELERVMGRVVEIKTTLKRYRAVNDSQLRSDLSEIQQRMVTMKRNLDSVTKHKERVDQTLAPIISELRQLESKKSAAESKLSRAEGFEHELSTASNSYERAMIHERCERDLGNGKPRSVIATEQRTIRQIERDLEKATFRAEEVGRKAARIIETLVIDGNNLCYEGRTFIGVSAIESLLPVLSSKHSVIVVFDSAIRRMLGANDSQIQNQLGEFAKVHVVASRRLADETVLDLASTNKSTYVISNDRFADFNEKMVVKEGRIIRHEIVNGNIFVSDLGVQAAF